MFKECNQFELMKDKEVVLNQLKKGHSGIVKRLITSDTKNLQKLLAMGIAPGRIIKVLQTYPVFILQIGHTQAAMDKELAERIVMKG